MYITKNILYLGWLGKGNVGDDVLFELFKQMVYETYPQTTNKTAINIDSYPMIPHYEMDISFYDLIVLGGGSLLHLPYWLRICQKGMKKNVPVVTWGTGIDGMYRTEEDLGVIAKYLTPFKGIYNHFDYLSVRGPYTKQILEQAGTTQSIYTIGDPGLFYSPKNNHPAMPAKEHQRHILVNWGTAYNHLPKVTEAKLANEMKLAITALIQQGYYISIYPIWTEDIPSVKLLAEQVNHSRCTALTRVYEAKTMMKMLEQSYVTINLKLHGNILSAAANRPFICLAYGGKCFDFSASADFLDYTIAAHTAEHQDIIPLVSNLKDNYMSAVNKIKDTKKHYHSNFKEAMDYITRIL